MFLLLIGFSCLGLTPERSTSSPAAQRIDPCKLKGAVFIEAHRNLADFSVYVERVEAFGKVKVFREEAAVFAKEAGYWYFTDQRGFADFTIFVEETRGFEDFTISFTEYRSAAGCQ